MKRSTLVSIGLLAVAGLPSVAPAAEAPAAVWPAKPLRMIVPFAAGGAVDTTGRMIAVRLGDALGRPVLVENRPGA
ncbi:MAG: tripartite tricarboxylate transporter substrate binding protein, partial [bacterium]